MCTISKSFLPDLLYEINDHHSSLFKTSSGENRFNVNNELRTRNCQPESEIGILIGRNAWVKPVCSFDAWRGSHETRPDKNSNTVGHCIILVPKMEDVIKDIKPVNRRV